MKTNSPLISAALGLAFCFLVSDSRAQVLYSQNFDTDDTANWTANTLGTGSDANFFFDYSSIGIPSAPNSTGGTTFGLRLRANQFGLGGTFPGGVSVSPIGKTFTGSYELRFDLWWNFNGPAPLGGNGSTQITGGGIGTAGTSAQIAGGTVDSIFFGASGDGGSSVDFRAYAPAVQSGYLDASGVFAAGTANSPRNNTNPYYSVFGGKTPPAEQTALFSQQTGATAAGAPGFAWHDSSITKSGNTVTWTVDGLLIATVDTGAAGTVGGDNILFNQFDINAAASTDPNSPSLLFGLIDNVRVNVVPEPSVAALAILGFAACLLGRRRTA